MKHTYLSIILIMTSCVYVHAGEFIQVNVERSRPGPDGRLFTFYPGSAGAVVNCLMGETVTTWVVYEGEETYSKLFITVNRVENGCIVVEASGLFTGIGYGVFTGTYWHGWLREGPDLSFPRLRDGDVTDNAFSFLTVTVSQKSYTPYSGGGGDTNITIDGEYVAPQTVDPTITGPGFTGDGEVEVDSQDLAALPGQTTKFWSDWKVAIKPLDGVAGNGPMLNLGNVSSNGANWERELSFYDGENAPADWYRGSTIKSMIDAVFIGFSTFAAFLMPYNELRKGV